MSCSAGAAVIVSSLRRAGMAGCCAYGHDWRRMTETRNCLSCLFKSLGKQSPWHLLTIISIRPHPKLFYEKAGILFEPQVLFCFLSFPSRVETQQTLSWSLFTSHQLPTGSISKYCHLGSWGCNMGIWGGTMQSGTACIVMLWKTQMVEERMAEGRVRKGRDRGQDGSVL